MVNYNFSFFNFYTLVLSLIYYFNHYKEFQKRAQCIIDQYSSFVLEDVGLNINGKMTNGENIADNGGLKAVRNLVAFFEQFTFDQI